jgi:hypothetical protein
VLGLREQIERERLGVDVAGGDHEQVARAGEAVDPDLPEHLALGLLHVQVPGTDDYVHGGDGLRSVRERGDPVGAPHPVDGIHAGEPARRQHYRIEVAVTAGRRAHGDVLDAGESRRHRPHDDRARIRGPAAGDVDGRALHRGVAADDAVVPKLGGARRPGYVRARHGLDILDRALDPVADSRVEPCRRRIELIVRYEERLRLPAAGVERPRVVADSPVTARAHRSDDQRHPVPDRLRRRHKLADVGRDAGGVVAAQCQPLTPHRSAPAARRSWSP